VYYFPHYHWFQNGRSFDLRNKPDYHEASFRTLMLSYPGFQGNNKTKKVREFEEM
jgi:hypothetical protein